MDERQVVTVIGAIAISLLFGFGIGMQMVPVKIIEKNVTVEVPVATTCPNVTVSCPPCPLLSCPPCAVCSAVDEKCYCKAMGGYAVDKVWWYQDNKTTGYTS